MDRTHASRTFASTVLLISLVATLVACQPSGASPSGPAGAPSGSAASPSAAAGGSSTAHDPEVGAAIGDAAARGIDEMSKSSPKPASDVAALFRKTMDGRFSADATIAGKITLGSMTFTCDGSATFDGPDSHQVLTIAGATGSDRTETLSSGGVKYTKRGEVWFEDAKTNTSSGPGSDFSSALRSALDVVDRGVETKSGRSLHHLTSRRGTPIPMAAVGMADPAGDGTLTIEFYVEDDGTPVIMAMAAAWTAVDGSSRTPARMTLEITFSNVGGRVVIERPAQVWTTYTSKRFGYRVSYPADWETEPSTGSKEPDVLLSADDSGLAVYRAATRGYSLNQMTSGYIDALKRSRTKAKVTSNTATTIDGLRARRLEWTNVYKGDRTWNIEVVVVRGKWAYYFEYTTYEKTTAADRELATLIQKSIVLPAKATSSSSVG